ncbi:hypothetical protein ACOME3_010632 [Neoechinorhynchus agilis]
MFSSINDNTPLQIDSETNSEKCEKSNMKNDLDLSDFVPHRKIPLVNPSITGASPNLIDLFRKPPIGKPLNRISKSQFHLFNLGNNDELPEHLKKLREATGDSRAGLFLRQNISLAVQRGNAASVMATVEEGQKLEFGGRW